MLAIQRGVEALPPKLGSPGVPVYGYNLTLRNEQTGDVCAPGEKGVIALGYPLPPLRLPLRTFSLLAVFAPANGPEHLGGLRGSRKRQIARNYSHLTRTRTRNRIQVSNVRVY